MYESVISIIYFISRSVDNLFLVLHICHTVTIMKPNQFPLLNVPAVYIMRQEIAERGNVYQHPSGNKPLTEPILTKFYVAIGRHWGQMGWESGDELLLLVFFEWWSCNPPGNGLHT